MHSILSDNPKPIDYMVESVATLQTVHVLDPLEQSKPIAFGAVDTLSVSFSVDPELASSGWSSISEHEWAESCYTRG